MQIYSLKQLLLVPALVSVAGCEGAVDPAPVASAGAGRVGDTVYVCGCPPGCPCSKMEREPGGSCACNMPLVRATVMRVDNGVYRVRLGSGTEKTIIP